MTTTFRQSNDSRNEVDQRVTLLKRELHNRLVESVDLSVLRTMQEGQLREEFRRAAEELCRRRPDLLSQFERRRLIDELVDETLGLGPLEPLMRDGSISDILINGPQQIYVEREGMLELTPVSFYSHEHLLQVVQRMVARIGRRIDESCPMADARLPDGSRVNAIIRPLALDGALVSIRRFSQQPWTFERLIASGTLSEDMLLFLAACVRARLNILVSGGTGSGKTTLLNVLSSFIPNNQRIVTIEDAAELRLQQPHVARMETRPPNVEGAGAVSTRDLLRNALRMRPDRILVGECRGNEALDMLQAMNTGHDGSLTTIHANSAPDAVSRLEMLVGMAGFELPLWYIARQIASGIQLVVHVARLSGGVRRVVQVSEVQGLEKDRVVIRDIFQFQQTGVDAKGRAQGSCQPTGFVPRCLERLRAFGIDLSAGSFETDRPQVTNEPAAEPVA